MLSHILTKVIIIKLLRIRKMAQLFKMYYFIFILTAPFLILTHWSPLSFLPHLDETITEKAKLNESLLQLSYKGHLVYRRLYFGFSCDSKLTEKRWSQLEPRHR